MQGIGSGVRSEEEGVMSGRYVRRAAPWLALTLVAAGCQPGVAPGSPGATTAAPAGGTASAAATQSAGSGGSMTLRWYCCLGTGEDAELQVPVEEAVAKRFSESHPGIQLKFEVTTYNEATDTLATQIQGGNAPDIVGPVGVGGAESFHGQWLDLQPYIDKTGFDLTEYEPAAVDLYKSGGEGTIGIPFAVFPSVVFYRTNLFEEAGLNEPPHEYGEKYVWPDGTESDWNYETIRELGRRLTVDEAGNDATEPGFDASKIVQYGFEPYRDDLRGLGAYFGPGSLVADDGETVQIPGAWADAWKYFYDGIWEDHSVMTTPVHESDDWGGQLDFAFFNGRVAMHTNFLWSTYGISEGGDEWDVAAVPSHEAETTSPLNADTFRILKDTKHPDEAFEAMRYLIEDAAAELQKIYAAMPAKPAEQDAFFESYGADFENEVDWNVVKESLQYADIPNWEGYMPEYNATVDALSEAESRWGTEQGLDMDAEIESLRETIQGIWDR